MKLDIPATDCLDDCLDDEFLDDEIEGPLDEEFAPWMDTAGDSSDTDDETEGPPAEEDPNWPQTSDSSTEIDKVSELVQDDWDPLRFEHEGASSQCLLRIQYDMLELSENPLPDVLVLAEDTSRFLVWMAGPTSMASEGRLFTFLLQCPPDYPMRPPRVRLMNTDKASFSPNLHESGKVSLDILGTTDKSTWSPAQSIKSVLVAIYSLLMETP